MQVLSSLSSIPFYAPSAGFAPTNSADVSAIASAYQVVSATATQLYAGTAYVTSVNDNPISASRAGQAANASMANSAYYDGTGRLISALPDESTVSAIASAYADSAASSKLDTTAQVVTATGSGTWDYDDCISSVNGSPLYAKYAGLAYYDSALRNISQLPDTDAVSAIASSYAESAASSKQDTLTFGYNTADQISSIDGSALGGMDEAAVSAIASAYAESAASSKQDALTFGYDAGDKISSIDGSAIAGGEQVVTSLQYVTSQSGAIVGSTTGDKAGYGNKVFSARYYPDQGWYNYQSATALASVGFTSFDSNITGEIEYPFEIFMIPYGATNYGNIDYISSVGSYMGNYGQFNDTSDFRIATGMATMSGYSAILDFNVTSLPFNTQYGPPMWGSAVGMVLDESENCKPVFSVVYGSGNDDEGRCAQITDGPKALGFGAITTISAVSGINELGIAGGGAAGVDSATCSAIASAYAESAVSSVSGNYYTTANESGFLTAQAQASWSESASASPSYIQDKPDLVDIVAGPGIVVDNPDGNTLRVSMAADYETVLWANTGTSAVTSMVLSEDVRNFDRFRVYWLWNNGTDFVSRADEFSNFYTGTYHRAFNLDGLYRFNGTTYTVYSRFVLDTGYSSITYEYSNQNNDTAKYIVVNKIVGINRTASAQ